VVPQTNLPQFVGVGYPVLRYEPQPGNGDVRIYRYVSLNRVRQWSGWRPTGTLVIPRLALDPAAFFRIPNAAGCIALAAV
jgi:hypothetical protein